MNEKADRDSAVKLGCVKLQRIHQPLRIEERGTEEAEAATNYSETPIIVISKKQPLVFGGGTYGQSTSAVTRHVQWPWPLRPAMSRSYVPSPYRMQSRFFATEGFSVVEHPVHVL